jgi:hypothetical protein
MQPYEVHLRLYSGSKNGSRYCIQAKRLYLTHWQSGVSRRTYPVKTLKKNHQDYPKILAKKRQLFANSADPESRFSKPS